MRQAFREYRHSDLAPLARLFERADRHDGVARALSPARTEEIPLYAFAPRYPLGLERGLTRDEVRSRLGNHLAQVERHLIVAADGESVDACVSVYPVGSNALWMLDWVVDPAQRGTVTIEDVVAAGLERIGELAAEAGRTSGSNQAPNSCTVEARGLREDADVASTLNKAEFPAVRTFAILACEMDESYPAKKSIKRELVGVKLRAYRAGDAPVWIAAFNASFSDHWGGFSYSEESWGRHAASPRFRNKISVVADTGRGFAGICHCAPSLNPSEQGLAHLHILGVHPDYRRQGLGHHLMIEAMRRLREHGFTRVELDMDSLNSRALPLYERLGFTGQEAITMYRRRLVLS